jgi:predicted DNA-binding transcriptional regulator YafY
LRLLLGRSRWNAQDLAAEQECSERTVYRDLQVLLLAGVPVDYDLAARCYRIHPDCRFPAPNLTNAELVGQATATVLTTAPGLGLGRGAKTATHKLAAASKEEASQLLHDAQQVTAVLDLHLADHRRHQQMLQTVQAALIHGKQLTGRYASPYQPQAVQITLYPYRLCLIKQAWYLIGHPAEAAQPRTYRIARFQTLRKLDAPAATPADFDLRRYFGNAWAVYRGTPTYDGVIHFTPEAAPLVTETTWHPTQQVQRHRDGSVTLQFRVDGLEEIQWWVSGWASRARVLAPPELRALVADKLRTALELQATAGSPSAGGEPVPNAVPEGKNPC